MHHPVSGINSLIHSVSLASHVLTHLLIHLSAHLSYHHHVAQSDDLRFLGVQLSSDLSLDKHVNVVSAKCFFQLRQLYAASDVLWMTTLSLHSFMRSSRAESIIAAAS